MKKREKKMNFVTVTGGNKTQRKVAETTTHQMIAELLPRFRTLDIEVKLKKFTKTDRDAIGWCLMEDNNRTFVIEINKDIGITELVTTVCHEMVHVKQYARKELKEDYPRTLWFNKEYTDGRCYPWELEAWKMQKILAHNYIKQQKLGTITVLKSLDKRS